MDAVVSGYIVVSITDYGYMKNCNDTTVHRETRNMHTRQFCYLTLEEAKTHMREGEGLLALTSEGGGMCLWVKERDQPRWKDRLSIHSGCYGAWPVRRLSE